MARSVKEEEYTVKRNEILAVAQRLVYTQGYEQMSIQDILDDLHISKGAFYHYFNSKQALLEALIERTVDEIEQVLAPVVDDPTLPALAKLHGYFDTAGRWKTAHKAYMIELMRVWYQDHNAVVRQKVYTAVLKRIMPIVSRIIRQGIQEGVFLTPFPDQASEIVFAIFQSLSDAFFVPLILRREPGYDDPQRIENTMAAYTDALERVLGAPAGSLHLLDAETLKEWTTHE